MPTGVAVSSNHHVLKMQGGRHWGDRGSHGPLLFCVAKKKERKRKEKRKSFKAETIKMLSPRSKCYYFSHSRTSRIQKVFLSASHGGRQYFSVSHGPSTWKSISSSLKCHQIKNQNFQTDFYYH